MEQILPGFGAAIDDHAPGAILKQPCATLGAKISLRTYTRKELQTLAREDTPNDTRIHIMTSGVFLQ